MTAPDERPVVLVADDDEDILTLVTFRLERAGCDVVKTRSGDEALRVALEQVPALAVLDVTMPGLDGYQVTRELRRAEATSTMPIILLTARSDDIDVVVGLESGADDYVVKPVQGRVLDARIRAVLRRRAVDEEDDDSVVEIGRVRLDADSHTVEIAGEETAMPLREFELLEYLMRNERLVVSRERLLEDVWGYDPFSMTNTIDVFVSNLRRKLEEGGESRLLHTKRGVGYVLKD